MASLQGMLREMKLTPSTFVFTEGMSSWTLAKDVEQLMPAVKSPSTHL